MLVSAAVAWKSPALIGFSGGRVCKAKNLSIEAGNVFSVEDKDLVDCSK
jgi:hypothetical protein